MAIDNICRKCHGTKSSSSLRSNNSLWANTSSSKTSQNLKIRPYLTPTKATKHFIGSGDYSIQNSEIVWSSSDSESEGLSVTTTRSPIPESNRKRKVRNNSYGIQILTAMSVIFSVGTGLILLGIHVSLERLEQRLTLLEDKADLSGLNQIAMNHIEKFSFSVQEHLATLTRMDIKIKILEEQVDTLRKEVIVTNETSPESSDVFLGQTEILETSDSTSLSSDLFERLESYKSYIANISSIFTNAVQKSWETMITDTAQDGIVQPDVKDDL